MILQTTDLTRHFRIGGGWFGRPSLIRAVNAVSLTLSAGECLGIVGESGSGKSTLGRLLLGLLPPSSGNVTALGTDLASLHGAAWRHMRRDLALVHQNPRGALDPRRTVGYQVAEPLVIHDNHKGRAWIAEASREAFASVGLSPTLFDHYPHQLSGGQRQRVVLARALTLRPKLIVMDEPTSALDVSVQAQVMELIENLRAQFGLSYVFISHDLRNLRRIADRIAVMYAGRIVEEGPAANLCRAPLHPYTNALLASVPVMGKARSFALPTGEPPDPAALPNGCAYHPRCPLAIEVCRMQVPKSVLMDGTRAVACHRPGEFRQHATEVVA